jgi:uridylate kinase
MYKRILLKISGEQLAGDYKSGIDPNIVGFLAEEVKKVVAAGCEVVMVAGGGNMIRGAEVAGHGIRRVTGEQMGMLSGLINSMAITDIFESHNIPTRCLSNIFAPQVAESYSYRLAEKQLERGRVILVAGGMGRPFFTHDTVAVNLALELQCDVVLKATKVDAVYDKDPMQFPDATKINHMTFQEALSNDAVKVMDKAALGHAMEQNKPIIVFKALESDSLLKVVQGQSLGTYIGPTSGSDQ